MQVNTSKTTVINAAGDAAKPFIFGVLTGHYQSRWEYAVWMCSLLSAAQIAANIHIYPQRASKKWSFFNPTNYRQYFELIKMTIKQPEHKYTGDATVWTDSTTCTESINDISGNTTNPSSETRAWDQAPRTSAAVDAPVLPGTIDPVLSTFILNSTAVLKAGNGNVFETYANGIDTRPVHEKLSWIFPHMRKYFRMRTIKRGWIGPMENQSAFERERVPGELQPNTIKSDKENMDKPGYSHFYFLRARSQKFISGPWGTSAGSESINLKYFPVQLGITCQRTVSFRLGGDSDPAQYSSWGFSTPASQFNYAMSAIGNRQPTAYTVASDALQLPYIAMLQSAPTVAAGKF